MANTTDQTAVSGNNVFSVRDLSSVTVSTLLNSNPVLAYMIAWNALKPDDILGVGDPTTSTVLSGAQLDPTKIKEIEECGSYSPLVETVLEIDSKDMAYRDTSATIALGSGCTVTLTVVNGSITAATPSSGSGYSGSLPTLRVVDTTGFGAVLKPVMSGGTVNSITVISGGYNYSASPTCTVVTNKSEGEKYDRPIFKWHEMENVGYIYHRDVERARYTAMNDKKALQQGLTNLAQERYKAVQAGQAQRAGDLLMYGTPTSQTADVWDSPFGIIAALDDGSATSGGSASYAGVDRSVTGNDWWAAKVDATAHTWGLKDVVQDALFTRGLANKGGNVDLLAVGPALYLKYYNETLAYTQQMHTGDNLKLLGEYGFKQPVVRFQNTYVVQDPRVPPKSALGLNLKSWIIAFKKGKKFAPTKPFDQSVIEGGKKADIFYVQTQWMPMCIAPPLNIRYTNLS